MTQNKVHQTVFQVEKLRNIVGISGSTAYHVVTYRGDCLGTIGRVVDCERTSPAANESGRDEPAANAFGRLFGRVRSTLAR